MKLLIHALTSTAVQLNRHWNQGTDNHSDVIMSAIDEISSVPIVYLTVCSGADQRKYQSSTTVGLIMKEHKPHITLHTRPHTATNAQIFEFKYTRGFLCDWESHSREICEKCDSIRRREPSKKKITVFNFSRLYRYYTQKKLSVFKLKLSGAKLKQ